MTKILIAQQQRNDYNNRKVGINIIYDLPREVQGGGWITENSSLILYPLSLRLTLLSLWLFCFFSFYFLDPMCMGDLFLFILVEVPFSWSSYRVDVDQVNILVPSLITPFF